MSNASDDRHSNSQVCKKNDPHGLTNEQLAGLYSPAPKREAPFLLTSEGRPALGALVVALAIAWYVLFGR